jgi:PTH1 family peptidyl-tRNA hydrolase
MKLVVGLGNPGQQYRGTRHNVGFDVLARLRETLGGDRPKGKFDGELVETRLGTEKIALLWPLTYMNLSGRSVRAAVDFFSLPLPNLLVVCDDFSLPLGRLRVRESGSSGGQKGLQNICQLLGSEAVPRLRCGIGSPPKGWDPADFVISKFSAEEKVEADRLVDTASQAVLCWLQHGIKEAMNRFNSTAGNSSSSAEPTKGKEKGGPGSQANPTRE